MLTLSGRLLSLSAGFSAIGVTRLLLKVYESTVPPLPLRGTGAWKVGKEIPPEGFACYLVAERNSGVAAIPENSTAAVLPQSFDYLGEGDIIRIGMPRRTISTLFRARSRHNTLLVTEQCNHYCLMCSQPPKRGSDRWLVEDAQEVVRMLPSSVESLGISGGEPTLLGDDLIELLRLTRSHLPNTSVDLLSNGRRFSDHGFCRSYAAIGHSRLTVGIPLYSDDPARHDYVVQAKGAFDETVRGILNLKRYRQRVEVRVVLHAQTTPRLVETAHFIARNLLFVDHVALMGLEMTGFTLANLDTLWIDPYDYQRKLGEAVDILQSAGMLVSIYNLPLCVIPTSASSAYRKSISDWKNEYVAACEPCARKSDCGGFFSSAVKTRLSSHILPFQ